MVCKEFGDCGGQGGAEDEAVLLKDGLEATDDVEDEAVFAKGRVGSDYGKQGLAQRKEVAVLQDAIRRC